MDKIKNIQKKIGVMKKDTQGYNYKYFDINQLLEKLTPLLHEEGLTLTQPLTHVNGRPALETSISDGEKVLISSTITLPDLLKPQDMGGVITYYRRYSLQSLFALEAEDDDASNITKPSGKPVSKNQAISNKSNEDYNNNIDPF